MGPGGHIINQNDYQHDGDLYILGEAYNQTGSTIWIASVQITFNSDEEETIFNTSTEVTLLPHGRKVAFHINAGPVEYDNYSLDLQYMTMPSSPSKIEMGIIGYSLELKNGIWHIQGLVENLAGKLDNHAQIVATLFDNHGQVAGVSSILIDAGDLGPGKHIPFEISINDYSPNVSSYEVQVFGS